MVFGSINLFTHIRGFPIYIIKPTKSNSSLLESTRYVPPPDDFVGQVDKVKKYDAHVKSVTFYEFFFFFFKPLCYHLQSYELIKLFS